MTNGEFSQLGEVQERPVEHTKVLDEILRVVKVHVDTIGAAQNIPDRDWHDYIAPFITQAHDGGFDLTEEQASHYVKRYLDRPLPTQPQLDLQEWNESAEPKTFMDKVHEVALDRLGAAAFQQPPAESQGEDND